MELTLWQDKLSALPVPVVSTALSQTKLFRLLVLQATFLSEEQLHVCNAQLDMNAQQPPPWLYVLPIITQSKELESVYHAQQEWTAFTLMQQQTLLSVSQDITFRLLIGLARFVRTATTVLLEPAFL